MHWYADDATYEGIRKCHERHFDLEYSDVVLRYSACHEINLDSPIFVDRFPDF